MQNRRCTEAQRRDLSELRQCRPLALAGSLKIPRCVQFHALDLLDRAFFRTAAGIAAAYVAMNEVYGPLFAATRAEGRRQGDVGGARKGAGRKAAGRKPYLVRMKPRTMAVLKRAAKPKTVGEYLDATYAS